METLIHNIRFAGEEESDGWVYIVGQRIAAVGHGQYPDVQNLYDGNGALAFPGVIDCHVHFREPGLTQKADIKSESLAAIAGGVTSYLDMPNTKPATTTVEAWRQKCQLAAEKSAANYGFFIGATNDNIEELKAADYALVPGVKLFMGSSTGNMLVDDENAITHIFKDVKAIVAVHAEDQHVIDANVAQAKAEHSEGIPVELHTKIRSVEACYNSTAEAVRLARANNHRLHICHITTAAELDLLERGPHKLITSEVSPHHLLWCDEDYVQKGTRIKMNPAVKSRHDRDCLRKALEEGLIDMVATDHAPHLPDDKEGNALTAASGAPLVQFSLVVMLKMFDESLVQRVMCEAPARIYGIEGRGSLKPGNYADLALVEDVETYQITDADVLSKCGWTPLDGVKVRHRIASTWLNGVLAYENGDFVLGAKAMPLRFAMHDA